MTRQTLRAAGRRITIAGPPGALLKPTRFLLGIFLLSAWTILDVPEASPHEAGVEGLSQRGAGARVRARLDRAAALASADPKAGVEHLDGLLQELHERRSSETDPLDADTRNAIAREALDLRTRVLLGDLPVPEGFRRTFVESVAAGATWSDWSQGVPASVTIAQAILESSWGRSAPGYNLFGLKGEGPAGSNKRRVVEYKGKKRKIRMANFRAYHHVDEALADHARILATSRHYARARAVAEEPARYLQALQGTYATDPRYAQKLTGMIERYDLARFDWNPRSPWR